MGTHAFPDTQWIAAQLRAEFERQKAEGLTLDKLAEKSGISAPYVSRILRGKRTGYTQDMLRALARALEMDYWVCLAGRRRASAGEAAGAPGASLADDPRPAPRAGRLALATSLVLTYGELLRTGL